MNIRRKQEKLRVPQGLRGKEEVRRGAAQTRSIAVEEQQRSRGGAAVEVAGKHHEEEENGQGESSIRRMLRESAGVRGRRVQEEEEEQNDRATRSSTEAQTRLTAQKNGQEDQRSGRGQNRRGTLREQAQERALPRGLIGRNMRLRRNEPVFQRSTWTTPKSHGEVALREEAGCRGFQCGSVEVRQPVAASKNPSVRSACFCGDRLGGGLKLVPTCC